jgi:hypothetical protein
VLQGRHDEGQAAPSDGRAFAFGWLDGPFAPSQHRPMALLRRVIFEALAACALVACGARPEAPGAAEGSGAGTSGLVSGSESNVDDGEVDVEVPSLEPANPPDAGAVDAPEAGEDDIEGEPKPAPLEGQAVVACFSQGVDCTTINVAVTDADEDVCVQLTIDNCGGFSRAGLPIDLPVGWRLGSASFADLEEGCVPGTYDPDNVIVIDADGSIGWNLDTPRPSEFAVDVTLTPSAAAIGADAIVIIGSVPDSLLDCEG